MKTRGPHPNEPQGSGRIIFHLGMTRGALIAFVFVFIVMVLGLVRLQQVGRRSATIAQTAKAVSEQTRSLARQNKAAIGQQHRTIRVLCDRGYVLVDLTDAAIALVRLTPGAGSDAFLVTFRADRAQLLDQLSALGSPCNG